MLWSLRTITLQGCHSIFVLQNSLSFDHFPDFRSENSSTFLCKIYENMHDPYASNGLQALLTGILIHQKFRSENSSLFLCKIYENMHDPYASNGLQAPLTAILIHQKLNSTETRFILKTVLTLLHSERPKLLTILAFLSAIGLMNNKIN